MNIKIFTKVLLIISLMFLVGCNSSNNNTSYKDNNENSKNKISEKSSNSTLYINGNIITLDADNSQARVLFEKDGKIVFIGNEKDGEKYKNMAEKIVDLDGKTLQPGFIDNHNHVFESAGGDYTQSCVLSDELLLSEQTDVLKKCATVLEKEEWMIGYGHSLEVLFEDKEMIPRELLDEIFPNNPVVIMEQTSHSMIVNSLALEEGNITEDTKNPQGGIIMKDSITQKHNGILIDNAGDIIMELAQNSVKDKKQDDYSSLMNGLDEVKAYGITTVGDGRLYWKRGWYDVWKKVEKEGNLTARVSLRPWIYPEGDKEEQLDFFRSAFTQNIDELLIVNQVKMYSDGIGINYTAKVGEAYEHTVFPEIPYGLNYIGEESMIDWFSELEKIGYGAHVHAIGDGAISETLTAIESMRKKGSTKQYHITHVEMVEPDDIKRFVKNSVVADIQPGSTHRGEEELVGHISEERLEELELFPIKEISDAGGLVTISSDWNVGPLNPLITLQNVIQNNYFPTRETALKGYTFNGAQALGIEDITGSLEVGKSADFVILSDNILDVPVDEVSEIEILETILEGNTVYKK